MSISRRDLLKAAGVGAAVAAAGGTFNFTFARQSDSIELPKPSKGSARVVIVGGGWSGSTLAKYIKKGDPKIDVVLIEKNNVFMSCPVSNLWLVDLVDLEFLIHDHLNAADKYGYHFVNAEVHDIDRRKRIVYTSIGKVRYDYLVLATGIDYDYSQWVGTDPRDIEIAMKRYPAAFKPGEEHFRLKRKIRDFEGGNFVITIPPGRDFRCPPGPYERATMVAWYFKQKKIPGKVILLDPHNDPLVKAEGFHKAWDEYVKGYIEYYPQTEIKHVDFGRKRISTNLGDIDFDDLNLYPRCKSAPLVYKAGLVPEGDRWPALRWPWYMSQEDERIFCTGDTRNQPFAKSGNVANSEAQIVAEFIVNLINGKSMDYKPPKNLCYSGVDKGKAIWISATFKYDPSNNSFAPQDVKTDNTPSSENWNAYLEWARAMYRDMFS